jgi:hypothetical protein
MNQYQKNKEKEKTIKSYCIVHPKDKDDDRKGICVSTINLDTSKEGKIKLLAKILNIDEKNKGKITDVEKKGSLIYYLRKLNNSNYRKTLELENKLASKSWFSDLQLEPITTNEKNYIEGLSESDKLELIGSIFHIDNVPELKQLGTSYFDFKEDDLNDIKSLWYKGEELPKKGGSSKNIKQIYMKNRRRSKRGGSFLSGLLGSSTQQGQPSNVAPKPEDKSLTPPQSQSLTPPQSQSLPKTEGSTQDGQPSTVVAPRSSWWPFSGGRTRRRKLKRRKQTKRR